MLANGRTVRFNPPGYRLSLSSYGYIEANKKFNFNEIRIYNDRVNNYKQIFYAVTPENDFDNAYNLLASLTTKEAVENFLATQEKPINLTVEHIVKAANVPEENVRMTWPLVLHYLEDYDINTPLVQIAAAATIVTETGVFLPVLEKMADPIKQPELAKMQAKYIPFIGCGLIQLTGEINYISYGVTQKTALNPKKSAEVLARYFNFNDIHRFAHLGNFARVRCIIGGPHALHMEKFLNLVGKLSLVSGISVLPRTQLSTTEGTQS